MRPLYRFDDVVLDLEAFRLTRGGEPVHLEPKVLELLGYLVQHRGRLVEKAELQAAVWRDAAVSESALTRAVAQLRKALDDDARESRYVETVPTRGYRFRTEVRVEEGRNGSGTGAGGTELAATDLDASAPGAAERGATERRVRSRGAARRRGLAIVALLLVLGVLLLRVAPREWRTRHPPPPSPPREAHRTLVSTSRGFNGFPAFSPDGSTIAFASDRSGRLEIYMRPLAAGAREVPVTTDGQDNVQPAWSPDGRYLAYHSMRRGGLWLLPALGGTPRQISDFGSAPAWSPDGRRIAFSSLGQAALESVAQYSSSLWMLDVDADGPSKPRRLTEPGRPPIGHGPLVFSPDGRDVLFVAEGVWAVPSDGSTAVRELVKGSATDVAVAPDGGTVYWTGWERSNWHIWRAPLGTGSGSAGERALVMNTGDQAARHLTMSRQGKLAYALVSLASEVAIVRLGADGAPVGPPTEPWPGATGRKAQLHFSPDGHELAFSRFQPGQGIEIWGLDLRTGTAKPLLPAAEVSFLNGWFPDGKALLVTSRGGGASKVLLRAPLDGKQPETLLPVEAMGWARLLPNGREIVYHAVSDGILNVHRASLDGKESRRLTNDPSGAGWPVPSPDGRTLAVELFRGNDAELALMPAEGGEPRVLTKVPGQHWGHDWSPDGRRVLYAARRDGLWNVYWMDVETGEERRLTDHGRVRDAVRTPAWSATGDRIAYERIEASGAIWVLDLVSDHDR
jgi:Tol biopolymer transport system component/DNA-binding winged helix-turn-helix (wHTH) protein